MFLNILGKIFKSLHCFNKIFDQTLIFRKFLSILLFIQFFLNSQEYSKKLLFKSMNYLQLIYNLFECNFYTCYSIIFLYE